MNDTTSHAGLGIALRAALDAGRAIMDIYTDPQQDFAIERKADNSPLTIADRTAHAVIARHLAPTSLPILSEEGAQLPYDERKEWDAFWLVDPLDGTKEFIKRNGEFTVNIALILGGRPHLGVVYAPALRRLYFGEPFLGAYRKDDIAEWRLSLPELVEQSTPLPTPRGGEEEYVVVASRSHLSPETEAFIDEKREQHPRLSLASMGSSLKLCLVAEGTADVYPRLAPTMEWDTAAAHAVCACAGKTVADHATGRPLAYNKHDLHNPWFVVS